MVITDHPASDSFSGKGDTPSFYNGILFADTVTGYFDIELNRNTADQTNVIYSPFAPELIQYLYLMQFYFHKITSEHNINHFPCSMDMGFHYDQQWTTKLNLRILSYKLNSDREAGCYTNCKKNS